MTEQSLILNKLISCIKNKENKSTSLNLSIMLTAIDDTERNDNVDLKKFELELKVCLSQCGRKK